MTDAGCARCAECGMRCNADEYHPYAACLMFKQCHNSETVRTNLEAVRSDTYHQGRVAGLKEAAKEVVFHAYARDAAIAFEIKANKLEQQAQGGGVR